MSLNATSPHELLRRRKALRRNLLKRADLQDIRVAVLGGSTTNEVVDFLELLLLEDGFHATFYQSDYNQYFQDAVLDPARIIQFQPHVIYVHTSSANLRHWPRSGADEAALTEAISAEMASFTSIWDSLEEQVQCVTVQNNFECPSWSLMGTLDAVSASGRARYTLEMNAAFSREARKRTNLILNDQATIAARMGLDRYLDPPRWFSYKIYTSIEGSFELATSVRALILALYGKTRKCLVLDLDNTLWGGVIGDDGPEKIKIGRETAVGEAYTEFQNYCLALRGRGVLLAVCSKNAEEIARQGLLRPGSVLKPEHFAAFKANWADKHENLREIAKELNLGLDSLVFVDDNAVERAAVAALLPMLAVPNVGNDVCGFIPAIDRGRYFESIALSSEDLRRADQYADNSRRGTAEAQFHTYDEFLKSLEMVAEIQPFKTAYIDRITQLINKTNQFNLTTRRYTPAEIERISMSSDYIGIYGKLGDHYGDYGLVSVIIGRIRQTELHLDLWSMSCRVLRRGLEYAMLDSLVALATRHGINSVWGYYLRTPKNGLVAGHFENLGFERIDCQPDGSGSTWRLALDGYTPKNRYIQECAEYAHA